MRRVLLFALLAGLLLLAGGSAYVLPRWLDWERHRDALAEIASERLGRPVVLEGRVGLVLLPQPRLEASRIAIGQAADEIQMSARGLRLRLDLWALLLGRIEVRELALVGAEINLPWPPTALPGLAPPPWLTALDARLEESRIQIGGAVIEGVNARLMAGSLGEALTAEGSLAWRGRPMRFQAVLGRAGDAGVAPLDVTATAAGATLRARGVLLTEGGFAGRLEASGPDLAALVPAPAGAFRATANLAAGAELMVANQLELTLGSDAVRGGALLRLVPEPRFELTLTAPSLDLEPWLAAMRGAGAQAVPVALDLSAEAAQFGPLRMTQLRAAATLQNERLTLARVSAVMPGGTALELSGGGGAARLELELRWRSARSAEWLEAMGWARHLALPAGASDGNLRLSWEGGAFAVTELAARFGATRATGGFVWRQAARPSLALGLDFDALETPLSTRQLLSALRDAAGDTDLQLRLGFGRLALGPDVWERLALDGAAEGGRLVLRRLAGRHLGLDLVLAGTLSSLGAGARVSEMTLEAEGPAGPLLGHLGIERPDLAAAPLRLRVAGAGPLDALVLRVESDLAEARLEAQATLDVPQERLQARLTLRHPGAVRLIGQMLASPPPDWIGEGSFSLIANLGWRPGAWSAESFELVAGEMRGRGQAALAWTEGRPALSGRLAMERLPLPDWHLLELGPMPALDLDLALTAERLAARGLPVLEGFAAQLRADAAGLRLEELRASLAGGVLAGGLRLEHATPPRLLVEGNFADVVLPGPLTGRPVDIAAGRLSGALRLEARGAVPPAWLQSLTGEASLALRDGVVQGFDASAAAAALGWSDMAAAEAALRAAFAGGATPIERGMLRLALQEGQATLSEVSLSAEAGLALSLSGGLDLPRDTLDLRLALPVPDGAPPPALHLSGPSMDPTRRPEIAAWLAWRADNRP
ncbi:AsmA family protein [Sediminicoccus sp. KRV36]|uniref:AsmA family protein n=1 Tax=Sediminicoccus sp. KRV36 TaxID=3133721 RepID=UPI00200C26BC|nr:AsmA family protein [Sediminicoccus rosea]UPY38203.1 AsmA family protein [Sediminicoccus rosea]